MFRNCSNGYQAKEEPKSSDRSCLVFYICISNWRVANLLATINIREGPKQEEN